MRVDPWLTDWRNPSLPAGQRIAFYATEHATPHPKSGRMYCTHDMETIAAAWSDNPEWGMGERKRSINGAVQSAINAGYFPKGTKVGKLTALTYDYRVGVSK